MKKSLLLGILASFFFAFTFVLNRSMNLGGGYWLWSASLRYYFTLGILLILLLARKEVELVIRDIKKNPSGWVLWSTVGFGLFYMPLSAASVYGESWFTAAIWQITIVCGILLTPLFQKKIPVKNLLLSGLILIGILIMQIPNMESGMRSSTWIAFLLILVAAFSYPLGNRKMMTICSEELSTLQRVFGMTICSMPFWLICGIVAGVGSGMPTQGQLLQSFLVALFSGVIATILFFRATDLVRKNPRQLAVIEATQSGEVIFTLILGILILGDAVPSTSGWIGILLIVIGMILNSIF